MDARVLWRYADGHEFIDRVRAGLPPALICVACNGGIQGREAHPALPETAEQIADSVYEAYVAGAAMVHVHARDPANLTSGARTAEDWHEVNRRIRERCPDIIINNTTGGSPGMTQDERLSCLDARPEVASLNLTPDMSLFRLGARPAELGHPRQSQLIDMCLPVTYGEVRHFAAEMQRRGIKPELEVYHSGGGHVIRDLIENGLVTSPYFVQTVMGSQTASLPTPAHVLALLQDFPSDVLWLCSGIGVFQLPMTAFALLMGGHVRVGLEDNLYRARGTKLTSNGEAVQRVARLAEDLNRAIATPAEARRMLGLSAEPSRY